VNLSGPGPARAAARYTEGMAGLRVCIDVDDLDRAVAFYERALGLVPVRRDGDEWAELAGAPSPIDLLARPPGTAALPSGTPRALRAYDRHWTPVHLDFIVDDVEDAVARAVAAGAILERAPETHAWGRNAILADPFGHGFCLVELRGRGYGEIAPRA
jgi:catechol 2,3-dioxygenase-like lactoylglutathione lyase family enzyme